jgi:hypothetical protein
MLEKLKTFITKNYHYIILALILLAIIITNIKPEKYIVGLDNITPYFNSRGIVAKAFDNNGRYLLNYLPQILILPIFELFKLIKIPTWAIIQIYLFSSLSIGVLGSAYLGKKLSQYFMKDKERDIFLFSGLIYLTSLVTLWMFNQPNFFFVASYASIPWVLIFINKVINREKIRAVEYILILYILILLLQSSMNLVAFLIFIATIFLISIVIQSFKKRLTLRTTIKILLLSTFPLMLYLLITQIALFIAHNNTFIFSYIYNYYSKILVNPLTDTITTDLRASSYLRNSFINNLLFSNSWMETHSSRGLLFENYQLYAGGLFRIIGLIPFITSLYAVFLYSGKKSKRIAKLHSLLLLSIILMSTTILRLTQNIPFLRELFRWSSSKFWVLYLIPISLIGAVSIIKVFKKNTVKLLIAILLLVYIYPVFGGQLFSKQLITNIPEEYIAIDNYLKENQAYYYFPLPQSTYFYDYSWGYFGSDIVTYLNRGNNYNKGIISYFENYEQYSKVKEKLTNCKNTEDIKDMIIYDTSINIENDEMLQCLNSKFSIEKQINNLTIYSPK